MAPLQPNFIRIQRNHLHQLLISLMDERLKNGLAIVKVVIIKDYDTIPAGEHHAN